jgi:transketolase C-terminal domain/subunit
MIMGGIGEMVAAQLSHVAFKHIALGMTTFGESGEGPELWAKYGYDAVAIRGWL